jgi:hypothetical protein
MNEQKKYRCIMYGVPRTTLPLLRGYDVLWVEQGEVLLGWYTVPAFAKQMHQSQENLDTKLVQFDEPLFNAWFNVIAGSQDTQSKAYKMAVALAA